MSSVSTAVQILTVSVSVTDGGWCHSILGTMASTNTAPGAADQVVRNIDPCDFDTYEDYVDAYIYSDDIKFLQVSKTLCCWFARQKGLDKRLYEASALFS